LVATTLLNVHENLVTLLIIAGEESSTEFTDNETINDGGVVFFTEFARDNENAKEVLKQRTRSSTDLLELFLYLNDTGGGRCPEVRLFNRANNS
jgi:hypothetical protein